MQSLSQNILCEIFSFLTLKELIIVGSTCRRLSKMSESDILWTNSIDKGTGTARKNIFITRGKITSRIFAKSNQILFLSGHSRTINSIKINQNKILTSSEDCSVRLFNTKKVRGKTILTHSNSVSAARFWAKGVVSISADRSLKIWRKEKKIVSINAHKSGITKLRLMDNNIAATGGYDGAVKLWNLDDDNAKAPVLSTQDFAADISLLETFGNFYASSSSGDNAICLRDVQRPDRPMRFEINNPIRIGRIIPNIGCVRSLLINPPYLFSGETDTIKLWDMRTDAPVIQIFDKSLNFPYENRSGIFKLILNEPHQLLVGSNGLMGLVEYDLRTLKSFYYPVHDYQILTLCQGLDTLKNLVITSGTTKSFKYEISVHQTNDLNKSIKLTPGHKGVINCIDIGNNCIASGGKDGSARVLLFNKSRDSLKKEPKTINIYS